MKLIKITLIALSVASMSLSAQAQKVNQCKGQTKVQCDAKDSCSWVDGYERKDGVKVSAFCRTKTKKASK